MTGSAEKALCRLGKVELSCRALEHAAACRRNLYTRFSCIPGFFCLQNLLTANDVMECVSASRYLSVRPAGRNRYFQRRDSVRGQVEIAGGKWSVANDFRYCRSAMMRYYASRQCRRPWQHQVGRWCRSSFGGPTRRRCTPSIV